MTDQTYLEFIEKFGDNHKIGIHNSWIDGVDCTFLVKKGELLNENITCGIVMTVWDQPKIFILESFRGRGLGLTLLKAWLKERLVSQDVIFYTASTEHGKHLINKLAKENLYLIEESEQNEYTIKLND